MTRAPDMDGAEPGADPDADPDAAPDARAGGEPTRVRRVSPRPSPAASAASRARRIGGRTAAAPAAHRPADDQDDLAPGVDAPLADAPLADTPLVDTVKRPIASAPADPDVDAADEADVDAADEAADASDSRASTAVPEWLRWAPGAILIAGVIALAVLMAIVSHGVWWGGANSADSRNTARDQVTAAAKTCVATANTYKYTALPQFEASGAACTTGAFTAKFKSAVDTLIKPNAAKLKFSQTAQINNAAVESVAEGQWTVLLFGQLSVTNVNTPKGRTDPFAAVVRMQRANGKWLISDLRTVS